MSPVSSALLIIYHSTVRRFIIYAFHKASVKKPRNNQFNCNTISLYGPTFSAVYARLQIYWFVSVSRVSILSILWDMLLPAFRIPLYSAFIDIFLNNLMLYKHYL